MKVWSKKVMKGIVVSIRDRATIQREILKREKEFSLLSKILAPMVRRG